MARALVVTSMYPPHHYGGYEQACRDTVTRWRAHGHDVTVLTSTLQVEGAGPADDDGGVLRRLPIAFRDGDLYRPPLWRRPALERAAQAGLREALELARPDVVSVWQMGALSLGLLSALVDTGLPLVYVMLDDWLIYGPQVDPWMNVMEHHPRVARALAPRIGVPTTLPDVGASGTFCFISRHTQRRAEAMSRWRFTDTTLCYCGIDTTDFPIVQRAPSEWNWRLLHVGRLDPRKGIETAVRALPLLPAEATLDVLPRVDDPYRHHLEAVAAECGVGDRVRFEFVGRADLAKRYREADAVLFPTEWDEPFGLVPVEAMASGTPVVATGSGGSSEFLADGVNCLLVPQRRPDALAAAVIRLAGDPTLRATLVEGGAQTARELSVDAFADCLERWHVAAAERFAGGRPVDRQLTFAVPVTEPSDRSDPIGVHQASTKRVLETGDPDAIKRLYVELGDLLEEGLGSNLDDVPVLSRSETHPVVVRLLEGVDGLILDAGCGPNPAVSIELGRRPHRRVVGFDIGVGTVRLARAIAHRDGVELLGIVGDVERLPFRDGAFAGIVCDDTIEHLPDDAQGVRELARVLTADGRAVLATPNRHSAVIVMQKLRDALRRRRQPREAYFVSNSHLREYTWREFERLTAPALRTDAREGVGWADGGWKRRLISRAVGLPGMRRVGQMIVLDTRRR